MIDVARIDHLAATGSGLFHRASPLAKLAFLLGVVAAAVVARDPVPLAIGYLAIILVAAAARLPWLRLMALSWYAAVFALLYGVTLETDFSMRALYIVKAITPACAILIIIMSTPYPSLFAVLGRVLPETITAGLFMTYRAFFILLDMMNHFIAAIRLRGGFSPGSLYQNAANVSQGLAMLLVRSVERSSRIHAVMLVRGYRGSMAGQARLVFHREDFVPVLAGIGVLALVAAW